MDEEVDLSVPAPAPAPPLARGPAPCPYPAGHGPFIAAPAPSPYGLVHAPLQAPAGSPSSFRFAMGDELGRKAAVGLLFLGTGAIVVAALALTGWLLVRVVRAKIAERRARNAAPDIGVREIGAPTRANDVSASARDERPVAEARRPAA